MNLQLLLFICEKNIYALPIKSIVRVMRALEITSIPKSSPLLYGVFDLQGMMIPVISARALFSLPEKKMELEDALIIIEVHGHQVALLADSVNGVFELKKEDMKEVEELFHGLIMTDAVKWEESLLPVLDIDRLIDREILTHLAHQESEYKQHGSN